MATDEDQDQQAQQEQAKGQSKQGQGQRKQAKGQSKQGQASRSKGQGQGRQQRQGQSDKRQGQQRAQGQQTNEGAGQDDDGSAVSAVEAAGRAREQLAELLGMPADTVSGVSLDNGSWRVRIEVVEHRRLPPSTDVLATYEVELDGRGRLTGYERTDRYLRGQPVGST